MLVENTLRASEEDYKLLFENNPQPMWVFDVETLFFLAVNDAALEAYGYSEDEFLLMTIKDIRPPEDIPALLSSFSGDDSKPYRGLWKHRKKGGTVIDVEITSRPITFAGRSAILVLSNDISGRKQAEPVLDQYHGLLQAIIEQATDAIFIKDLQGRYQMVNSTCAFYMQRSITEIIGKTDAELLPAKIASRFVADDKRMWESGKSLTVEDVIPVGTETRILLTTKTPYYDQQGKVIGLCGIGRDVTEQKRAEEALRASEERFHAFMDNSPAIAYMKDDEGRYVYVSRAVKRLLGREPEFWIGKTDFDTFPKVEAKQLRKHDLAVLSCGRTSEYRETICALDGQSLSLLSFKFPIMESSGRTLLGGITVDITERERAKEEQARLSAQLESERQRLNSIVASVPGVVWEAWSEPDSATQRIDFVNDYVEAMLGYSVEEWLRTPNFWLTIIHPEDKEQAGRKATANFSRGQDTTFEFRWVSKDGRAVWVETHTTVVFDDKGKPVGLRGVTIDVTERKKAEEQLTRLATAVEQVADSILITDAAANILYVNPAYESATGYPSAEVLGRNPRFLKSGKLDPKFYSDMWATLSRGEVWAGRFINRKKDGTLFEEVGTISPIRAASGEIVNYVAVKRDVTREAALEEQLRQAQKMEAVGRLAGGVAHDFNNMLTAINGYTDLTLRKLYQNDPLCKNLEEVKKAADRASGLTSQLLAFSRKQIMETKVLDLNAIISDMNMMLPRLIGEDIKINMSLAADLGQIKADPGQIEQVIVNLVVNARDAMPDGGILTIKTSNVMMDEKLVQRYVSVQPGSHILLSISDTGCGMDEETQQKIFEPFFTTKELGKGTGLGLSTVFGIIKQSGGGIWVDSEVGQGTTFRIYLPCVDAQLEAVEAVSVPQMIVHGTETILLVEDDDLVRGIARTTLEMCGYEVLEAANGGEALLIGKELNCEIDLLLTDVVMPRMSGRTLVKEMHEICPKMKVLYMSGYADDVIAPRGVFTNRSAFLNKPFTPEALHRKVREVLDKEN
jgi:two-component system, cell cycle sensor histidine kinase and response regulator CckA